MKFIVYHQSNQPSSWQWEKKNPCYTRRSLLPIEVELIKRKATLKGETQTGVKAKADQQPQPKSCSSACLPTNPPPPPPTCSGAPTFSNFLHIWKRYSVTTQNPLNPFNKLIKTYIMIASKTTNSCQKPIHKLKPNQQVLQLVPLDTHTK